MNFRLKLFAAADKTALHKRLAAGLDGGKGPVRLAVVATDAALEERCAAALADLAQAPERCGSSRELAAGIYYGTGGPGGELAFVFTGGTAAYAGMGRDVTLAMPSIVERAAKRCGATIDRALWMYDEAAHEPTDFELHTGSLYLAQVHAEISQSIFGLRPHAALGLSMGETSALFGLGAWGDMDAFIAEIDASGMYGTHLTGECRAARTFWGAKEGDGLQWRNWRVLAPEGDVLRALEGEERAHVCIVTSSNDCVIGGETAACERVVQRIGRERCWPFSSDMVVHAPEVGPFAHQWRALHRRKTLAVPGVRFYTHAHGGHYVPDEESAAEALAAQALHCIDFRRTVEAAYADGARVFLEHGPVGTLSTAIGQILGERPHAAIALDRPGRSSLEQLFHAAARLYAAGVDIEAERFAAALHVQRQPQSDVMPAAPSLSPAAQLPAVVELRASSRRNGDSLPPAVVAQIDEHPVAVLLAEASARHDAFVAEQTRLHKAFLALFDRVPASPVPAAPPAPVVRFGRAELEIHATGTISTIFGPRFREQDGYARQVRMPSGPMRLVDRVTDIAGEAAGMGTGSVWTETDVEPGAWYVDRGRMTPAAVNEAGQSHLFLISWLGVDLHNRGERVFRLLGGDVTFHGPLPKVGERLECQVHVERQARNGELILFFFRYECRIGGQLRLTVRNAQAGCFTQEELASSRGVAWSPEEHRPREPARLDPPFRLTKRRAFGPELVQALIDGDAFGCFGEGFEVAATHQRTPGIPGGALKPFDEVTVFDPEGGPWNRGYLRAEARVGTDSWFYAGHFKEDPCMPGGLWSNALLHAMSFYIAALGFTIQRDAWRFEPVIDETSTFAYRGQLTPDRAHRLIYEVFVEEVVAAPRPTLYASLLCTCDGQKIFHCPRFGLRLVPDWLLDERRALYPSASEVHYVHPEYEVRGDYLTLLAGAFGPPTDAFGPTYARLEEGRRIARLPCPPLHFMSRVVSVESAPGVRTRGAGMVAEYCTTPEDWYFRDNGAPVMPICVLMESVMQPSGWMSAYSGITVEGENELFFRNIDGVTDGVRLEVPPASTLVTRAKLLDSARSGSTALTFFEIESSLDGRPVISLKASHAFVDGPGLLRRSGLASEPEERERLNAPNGFRLDLRNLPPDLYGGSPRLATGRLRMLDEITGLWPADGGSLGHIRGLQVIDPRAWYFKVHFFQDPVQPGALGVEGLMQLLEAWVLLSGHARGREGARFQAPAIGEPFVWKYRGSILPDNREAVTLIDIVRVTEEDTSLLVVGNGTLWVDGLKIYQVNGLSTRLVPSAVSVSRT